MTDVYSAISGNGVLSLTAPRFVPLIGVTVTTLPPGATVRDVDSPRRLMKVGWLAPGRLATDPSWPSTTFFEKERWIEFEREMISFGSPGIYCDRVRYHLEPGAVATVYVNDPGIPPGTGATPPRSPQLVVVGQGTPYTIPVSGRWVIAISGTIGGGATLPYYATISGSSGFNGQVAGGQTNTAANTTFGNHWEGFVSAGAVVTLTSPYVANCMSLFFVPTVANPG